MNILIVAYYYPPLSTGGTMRPLKMGKYLARLGHNVSILTHSYTGDGVRPGNPAVIRFNDVSCNKDRSSFLKKFRWTALRGYTELLNKLGVYHSIYSWWLRRVIKHGGDIIRQARPDVIIASYPPVECLEIGIYLSKTFHIPLAADFRDGLMFEPIESKRMGQYKCIRDAYARLERETLRQSRAVITVAEPIVRYFQATDAPLPVHLISNAFDPDDLNHLPGDVSFDAGCFNIVFTGRFGLSDTSCRVDFFFEAVRRLVRETPSLRTTLKIHLVGQYRPSETARFTDLIDAGIVRLHGFVPRPRALAMQKSADLLLIITSLERSSVVTGKLFEYLFAGKPILALTYKTVLADILDQTNAGWWVHPHQTEDITACLNRIILEPGFRDALQPDRSKIEQYAFNVQVEKLHRVLTGITVN